ncbi:MAG: choice-of-anchor D domain-containing protein [Candidatus Binatia bacterium]
MSIAVGFIVTCLLALPGLSNAQGLLETPQPGSFQSGIGLVRGWVCNATRVDIEVDGTASLQAVYGEPRADTQSVCGDANNGFSLQVNWNELGEGIHTVRALADGTEFGRAEIVVATLGQRYLQGAQGEFSVQPFPQTGQQTRIRWQESRQFFALSNGGTPASGGGSPRVDAKLEDPQPASFQSGIGLVRGWVCTASQVDIQLDGGASLQAVYGEPRGDTQSACGDTNNGFSLQINWNEVGDGTHTIRALADGVEFGQATFTVVTLGLGVFPTGLVGDFVLANFPNTSLQTEVRWQESEQNFVVAGARFPGISEALCSTKSGAANDGSGGVATVAWGNPCLLSGNTAVLKIQVPTNASLLAAQDGREARAAEGGAFFLCATALTIQQGEVSFSSDDFRLVDLLGNDICQELPPGTTLDALLQVDAQSDLNFNGSFTVVYAGQVVVTFQAETPPGAPQLSVSSGQLVFNSTHTTLTQNAIEERAQSGASQEQSFIITNTGGGTLAGGMTLIATGSGGNVFSLVSNPIVNVPAGQSQMVVVRYSPVSPDPVIGSVRITTNGGVQSVLLQGGQGTQGPRISVPLTSLDFGSILVGGAVERTFTVTNAGSGTLTGSVDVPAGSAFSVLSGGTINLGAGQSQTVTLQFAPTSVGQANSQATINTNGGNWVVLLNGIGLAQPQPPDLGVDALRLDFGSVEIGQSTTRSFSVTNEGEGTLIGSVSISGPFSIVSGGSFSLGANQSQTVSVRFTPTVNDKPGAASGEATVSSNGGSATVALSGTVVEPAPQLSVNPTSVDFGETCSPPTMSFTITNTGGGTLTGGVTTSSENFFIASGENFSLGAGESQDVAIRWSPSFDGTDTGSADIGSNAGVVAVGLSGHCLGLTK